MNSRITFTILHDLIIFAISFFVALWIRLDLDYALTQARLARILRASDWDNKKKEPILWKI